ncbi:MAG TPA: hypothetical protein VFU71_11790 [Burkholderiaceae bacterium]|nr:hypothetical protein [Burkholderiaceae bacterium]
MTPDFDTSGMTMTDIIRLQTLLSQELARRFGRVAALAFTDIVESSSYFTHFGDEAGQRLQQLHLDLLEQSLAGGAGPDCGRIVDTAGDGAFILLKALTSQLTEVDGRVMQRDQELPIRPGSRIKLAGGVMTLDFLSPSLADEGTLDEISAAPKAIATH